MHPLTVSRNFRLLVAVIIGAASSSPALATDYTWTGGSNNTWSTTGNWSSVSSPGTAPNATAAAVVFGAPSSGRVAPNLTASATVGSITYNSGASAFTISRSSSATLTLATGGSVTNNSTTLQTISAPVVLGGATTWNAASGDLSVSGAISGSSSSLTKSGGGTLTLSGANTYSGGTTISAGILQVGTGGKLGTGGVTDNGVLTYNSTGNITEANVITGTGSLNQTGTGTTSLTATTSSYQGGTTISGGVLQFTSAGSLGTGGLTVNGGTLRWGTGNTADVSGILTLGTSGGTLDTSSNNVAMANAVTASGALTKAGTGILTLNGLSGATSVTVNGGTLQAGAASVLTPNVAYTVNATASSGSAKLDLNGSNLSVSALNFSGSTTGANGVNTVTTGAGTMTLGGNVTYTASNLSTDAGAASITGNLDLGSSTRTFNIANSENTGTELTISAVISGTGVGLNKSGGGVLVLTGTNTYTGGTNVSGGTLNFASPANLGTGPVTLTGSGSTLQWATGNTTDVSSYLTLVNSGTLDTNGNDVTLAGPLNGNGLLTKFGGGNLTLSSAPSLTSARVLEGTLTLGADNALPSGLPLTVAGNISGTTTTLNLNGHDLTAGSLTFSASFTGDNSINTVTTGGATLTLAGNVTVFEGDPTTNDYNSGMNSITGKLDLGSSTRTFNVQVSYNTPIELNVNADVSGVAGLTKTGDGMMALNGTNTYGGNTIISGGTLRAASLPATTNVQINGGVYELASDRSFVYGTGAGQIQWTGGGGGFSAYGGNRTVNLTDTGGTSLALTWAGGNFVADGSNLTLSSLAADSTVTLTNDINLNGGSRTIQVNDGTAATDAVLSGVISNGSLNVTGGGTLKLTGANSYAGGTTISEGTIPYTSYAAGNPFTTVEFSSGSLGTGGVNLSGGSTLRWAAGNTDGLSGVLNVGDNSSTVNGATLDTNGNDVVLNAVLTANTSGEPMLTKIGAGVLTFNAPSSYFGYVTVLGGTLRMGVANALGNNQFGLAIINANTPNGSATFDTNGQDYYLYNLVFGGATAQANAINTVSTGAGAIYLTTGGFSYNKATLDANDPGPAFLTGNLNLYMNPATFAIDDSTNTTTELTISANISSNGSLGFTKTGAGTLMLSGNNTYTGNTILNGGTLRLASSTALGTGSLTISSGILELGGTGIAVNNTIALGSSVRTISTLDGSADVDATLGGKITGTGGITKTSAGTLRLSGANTYSGVTTVSAGTLIFAKANSLLAADWTAAKLITQSGATTAFNVGGTGEFTSANIDTLRGLSTSSANGFRSGSFLGLDTTNASGGKFTYASNITNTNSGANVLGLTKLGTGILVLSGTSTYTGATTVSGGTLQVDGSIANSATTVTGGNLQGKGTLGGVTMNTGSTLMAGDSATLKTLTTGALTFNAGATLQFKLDSSLGQSDSFNVTGQLTLNNTQLIFTDLAAIPAALSDGTTLTLLSYGAGMGTGLGTGTDLFTFNGQSLTEGSRFTSGANTFQINYAVGDPTITLTSVSAVPEPGTWLMLASGLGFLAFIQSRKRRT